MDCPLWKVFDYEHEIMIQQIYILGTWNGYFENMLNALHNVYSERQIIILLSKSKYKWLVKFWMNNLQFLPHSRVTDIIDNKDHSVWLLKSHQNFSKFQNFEVFARWRDCDKNLSNI